MSHNKEEGTICCHDFPTPEEIYRFAQWMVHRFWGNGEEFEDVVQACVLGAYESLPNHNPSRGRWTTYLYSIMRGVITRHAREARRQAESGIDEFEEVLAYTTHTTELTVPESCIDDIDRILKWVEDGMGILSPGLIEAAKRIANHLIESQVDRVC